ncbi:MAG: 30S ribosomal protein S21 [Planctomycetota bacterium]|jgi:small subunit ribosomal protein S21
MIRVEARGGEPLEKTLRRFKKRCEKEGLTKDIKKAMFHEKPSEQKRRNARKLEKRLAQEKVRKV